MLTDLKKHFRLLLIVLSLYIVSVSMPYLLWFANMSSLHESWLSTINRTFQPLVFMFWGWLMAIGLIGAGSYWSAELNDRFYFEVWRHRSYQAWLRKKVQFALVFQVILLGFGFLPFMLIFYHQEMASVLQVTIFLLLYSLQLSLILIVGTMLKLKMVYAFSSAFSFHLLNVLFDGQGWPNLIQYFLLGERAGPQSLLISTGLIGRTIAIMLLTSSPMTIMKKGSDFL